jgi:hypothetical protein
VILPDGQFIATRGGAPGPNGEVLYEIDPAPDLATLLAPVTLIPLTFDTPLAGSINGLDIVPGGMSVTLELSCPASVQRGDTATCVAVNPGGTLDDVDLTWQFLPDAVPYTPASQARFAPDIVEEGPATSMPIWEGPVVHPGVVVVRGELPHGAVLLASTSINVTERTFADLNVILDPAGFNAQSTLNLPRPGDTRFHSGLYHQFPFVGPDVESTGFEGGYTFDVVPSGPNQGYVYVTDSDFRLRRGYSINQWIEPGAGVRYPNTPYTTLQAVASVTNPATGLPYDTLLASQDTTQHEVGIGAPRPSHHSRFLDAAADFPSCGNLQAMVQRITANDPSELEREIQMLRQHSFAILKWASGHQFVYGHRSGNAWAADWNYPPPGIIVLPAGMPDPPVAPPNSTRCDVSNIQ